MSIRFGQIRSQAHQSNSHLMFQTMTGNSTTGNFEIAYIVERVKVTDGGNTVFLEKFGMQIDDITGLTGKTDYIHAPGKSLQIDVRTNDFTPFIHHFKRIFLAIEIKSLETGTATDLNMVDTGFHRRIKSRQEVFCFNARTETGLESITERTIHEFDFFHLYTCVFI